MQLFDGAARTLIASLGRVEVESMLAEDHGAVMTCGFCGEIYQLDEDDLKEMICRIKSICEEFCPRNTRKDAKE